jgi:hypothetical protein
MGVAHLRRTHPDQRIIPQAVNASTRRIARNVGLDGSVRG